MPSWARTTHAGSRQRPFGWGNMVVMELRDVKNLDFRDLIVEHGATQLIGSTFNGEERTACFDHSTQCLREAMVRFREMRRYLATGVLTREQLVEVFRILNGGHGGIPIVTFIDYVEPVNLHVAPVGIEPTT